ncbi:hypothetical protein [Ruegeria atlantica]|uniref:hypothetical protein n=1 Tax=Ruegeria atlantica TaxID=81569 RepID=UPI00147B3199|nr:hypothetical protein [Ruegeria atlantica]
MDFVLRCEMPVDLLVVSELLGNEHKFSFEGREIVLKLSKRYFSSDDDEPDQEASKIARCVGWSKEPSGKRAVHISIEKLFLTVQVLDSDDIDVASEMVISEAKTSDLFWEKNTPQRFQEAGRKLSNIASRAFDYWCRVTRWKTGLSYFGLPLERHEAHPGWRYLASVDPLEYVASFNDTATIHVLPSVTVQEWEVIQESLQAGVQTSLWIDTFHESNRRLAAGDVRGAYLDAAVSAESFIRHKLMQSVAALPATETAIRKRIESWNMTDVLSRFDKISTLSSLDLSREQLANLRSVFDTRNAIMHGKHVDLKEAELKVMLKSVKALVDK